MIDDYRLQCYHLENVSFIQNISYPSLDWISNHLGIILYLGLLFFSLLIQCWVGPSRGDRISSPECVSQLLGGGANYSVRGSGKQGSVLYSSTISCSVSCPCSFSSYFPCSCCIKWGLMIFGVWGSGSRKLFFGMKFLKSVTSYYFGSMKASCITVVLAHHNHDCTWRLQTCWSFF